MNLHFDLDNIGIGIKPNYLIIPDERTAQTFEVLYSGLGSLIDTSKVPVITPPSNPGSKFRKLEGKGRTRKELDPFATSKREVVSYPSIPYSLGMLPLDIDKPTERLQGGVFDPSYLFGSVKKDKTENVPIPTPKPKPDKPKDTIEV